MFILLFLNFLKGTHHEWVLNLYVAGLVPKLSDGGVTT